MPRHQIWGRVQLICKQCERLFISTKSAVAKGSGEFCSRPCFCLYRSQRLTYRTCLYCGIVFRTFPSVVTKGWARYCSKPCADKARTGILTSIVGRFWGKVILPDNPNACWGWSGNRNSNGYAQLTVKQGNGKWVPILASHLSFEIHFGPLPPWLDVLHRCDNPPCTNYLHLFSGTQKDNSDDMVSKGRARWQK